VTISESLLFLLRIQEIESSNLHSDIGFPDCNYFVVLSVAQSKFRESSSNFRVKAKTVFVINAWGISCCNCDYVSPKLVSLKQRGNATDFPLHQWTCTRGGNKCKVKLSLHLIKHHARKIDWESDGIGPLFLASALDGGEWSALRPWPCYSRWKNSWVPLYRRLDAAHSWSRRCRVEIISCPFREPKPGCSTRSPSLHRLSYPGYPHKGRTIFTALLA
jgi:hypothetical protein